MSKKNGAVRARIQRRLEQERWEKRLDEKRARAARRKTRVRAADTGGHRDKPSRTSLIGGVSPEPLILPVPPVLDLEGEHTATCELVAQLRDSVRGGQRVVLDFADVRTIRAAALVYLLAQIHKLRLELGDHCVTGTYPKSVRLERLLYESGFYDLLKVRSSKSFDQARRSTRYIRFKSDQKINGAEIATVRKELLGEDLSMPPVIARTIFRALSEAMTNVNHHGYLTKSFRSHKATKRLGGRWWLFATLSVATNTFKLVFYDAGVGIPKTLPRKYPMEHIRRVLALLPGIAPDDAGLISAAMALGRTRTELDNRGKGLLDLAKLIDIVGAGQMNILSRHGAYSYGAVGTTLANHFAFLEGTLIEWNLPLDRALNALPENLRESVNDS